ncbi:MAG: hypothetical protein R3220_10295 [Balneolaceae bacterium]|nr:hypothetical protein [Balneolaceae bacterium]
MKILFVLPVISDSYYQKRIEKLSELGVECSVMGFERDLYEGKPWNIPAKSIGHIEHGKYFKRIGTMLKSISTIRQTVKNKDVIYAYNLDVLLISWLATLFQSQNIKLVYDVVDIHPILTKKGFFPVILRSLERFLLKRTSVVVVTSPAYIEGYFKPIQKTDNTFVVIENKIDKDLVPDPAKSIPPISKKDHITIGYFGILRCEKSLHVLKEIAENSTGEIRLYLRGFFLSSEDFEGIFNSLEFANYGGSFIYPDDLDEMFKPVDLAWGAHYQTEENKNWAIVHRFYQACYFKRPLIVQAGSQNAKLVNRYNIGLEIDLENPKQTIQTIQNINFAQIDEWQKNMREMPEDVYTFTDEYERFINVLKSS